MMNEERQLSLLKGKRQKGEKAPLATEFATQCAIADALRVGCSPGWLWTHFPAGEYRTDETGRRLKRMGLKPGWSDMLLIGPDGRHYWMELKRGNSPLSEAQRAFILAVKSRGVPHALCRSFEEALMWLKDIGAVSDRVRVSV
jgi:hypothetical protein